MVTSLEPQATSLIEGSTVRICRAASRALRPYSLAGMWPSCHGPSISFPRLQYLTLYGFSTPCCRRRSLQRVPLSTLQYSTRSAAFSGVPVPRFTARSGSDPTARHHVMNSLVPNWLDSSEFEARLRTRGRSFLGPTPSNQLYPDTKLPPG